MAHTTVSVLSILRGATGSCDFMSFDGSPEEWKIMINDKANDSGFMRLVDNMLENGWMPGSAIGYRHGYINEGHHRLVAAILLGLDEVVVTDGWDDGPRVLSAHHEWGSDKGQFDYFSMQEEFNLLLDSQDAF